MTTAVCRRLEAGDFIEAVGLFANGPRELLQLERRYGWDPDSLGRVLVLSPAWGLWWNGHLSAFLIYQDLDAAMEILYLYTDHRHRRRGLMRRLFTGWLTEVVPPEVWLEVHPDNRAACQFYESLGFVACGRRPRYYRDGADALLYTMVPGRAEGHGVVTSGRS